MIWNRFIDKCINQLVYSSSYGKSYYSFVSSCCILTAVVISSSINLNLLNTCIAVSFSLFLFFVNFDLFTKYFAKTLSRWTRTRSLSRYSGKLSFSVWTLSTNIANFDVSCLSWLDGQQGGQVQRQPQVIGLGIYSMGVPAVIFLIFLNILKIE